MQTVDGVTTRTIVVGAGIPMPEEILINDPIQRRFQYRLTVPAFEFHRGTIDVIELAPDDTLVVYSTDCIPNAMALVIGGATGGALDELKAQFDAGEGPALDVRPPHHFPGSLTWDAKILFVTTDQQRYDTLGCNGGTLARTPVIDSLAAEGIRYERAVPQSVVCMPSCSTMLTGQHPSTHGVWMNGVPLPVYVPSVAALLNDQGYRTALVGKPHFEPFIDPFGRFTENRLASSGAPTAQTRHFDGTIGPHRGFEHLEFATHGAAGWLHYSQWIGANQAIRN